LILYNIIIRIIITMAFQCVFSFYLYILIIIIIVSVNICFQVQSQSVYIVWTFVKCINILLNIFQAHIPILRTNKLFY